MVKAFVASNQSLHTQLLASEFNASHFLGRGKRWYQGHHQDRKFSEKQTPEVVGPELNLHLRLRKL